MASRQASLKELQTVPGVGKRIAQDLWNIGIRTVNDLKRKDPERLYFDMCRFQGQQIDRCMLYVMRCAVYYASTPNPNPEKLLWWKWKD